MRVDAFHYDLPPALIAQRPADEREHARLMHLPPGVAAAAEHRRVADLPAILEPGTLVVVNDTRVLPARLLGRKRRTGGRVEVLLLRRIQRRLTPPDGDVDIREAHERSARPSEIWHALLKSTKPLKPGTEVDVAPRDTHDTRAPAALRVGILGRAGDGPTCGGVFVVALSSASDADGGDAAIDAALVACGHVPLPPYIRRGDGADDAARYQTVYARHDGAVAAPTAGLHLTRSLLARIAERGGEIATVTLHVGLGTFQPVQVEDLDDHPMHSEHFIVPPSTVDAIDRARRRGSPVVAIGTTTVRALESAADPDERGHVRAASGETRLLIQPGYDFRVVDGLLTNFHLPSSTLLALVSAFAGRERTLGAYALAVREGYRFFSYGDAMLVWRDR